MNETLNERLRAATEALELIAEDRSILDALSEEDRKQLLKDNAVINALAQAQQRGKTNAAGQRGPMTVQVNPLTGQVGPASQASPG